jgi:hypothetical protein
MPLDGGDQGHTQVVLPGVTGHRVKFHFFAKF